MSNVDYVAIGRAVIVNYNSKSRYVLKGFSAKRSSVEKLLAPLGVRCGALRYLNKVWVKHSKSPNQLSLFMFEKIMDYVGRCVVAGALDTLVGGSVTRRCRRRQKVYARRAKNLRTFITPLKIFGRKIPLNVNLC